VREPCSRRRRHRPMVSICNLSARSTVSLNRNLLLKPVAIGLISAAALAAAAPAAVAAPTASTAPTTPRTPTAQAPTTGASHAPRVPATHPHRCTPSQPAFTSLMATPTVSCREARALNTYMTRHETLSGRFVLNGATWVGIVSARTRNETHMVYRDGTQTVWITYGGLAS
jgi:hypothetical protein